MASENSVVSGSNESNGLENFVDQPYTCQESRKRHQITIGLDDDDGNNIMSDPDRRFDQYYPIDTESPEMGDQDSAMDDEDSEMYDKYDQMDDRLKIDWYNRTGKKSSKSSQNKNSSNSKSRQGSFNKSKAQPKNDIPEDAPKEWRNQHTTVIKKTLKTTVLRMADGQHLQNQAILKIYHHADNTRDNYYRRMRAFQEKKALQRLRGTPNVPQYIESNIPEEKEKAEQFKNKIWITMNFIPGTTLANYLKKQKDDKKNVQLVASLKFCQRLLKTVETLHSKGIIHRDLKPDNIIVDDNDPENLGGIIDYELAYVEEQEGKTSYQYYFSSQEKDPILSNPLKNMGNQWSRVPQLRKTSEGLLRKGTPIENYQRIKLRRSPTIDTSSICAILFSLLVPDDDGLSRDKEDVHIFHRYEDKIESVISSSIKNNEDLTSRIKTYLMDTFDKGFGLPDIQWTVKQLQVRLDLILKMVSCELEEAITTKQPQKMIDENIGHTKLKEQMKNSKILIHESKFTEIAGKFLHAKQSFTNEYLQEGCFEWSSNEFHWLDESNILYEKKSFDILTYPSSTSKRSMLVIFSCWIDDPAQKIKLSVGTVINGVMIALPVVRCNLSDEVTNICTEFNREIIELIKLSQENHMASVEE